MKKFEKSPAFPAPSRIDDEPQTTTARSYKIHDR
jgi:hypothetical protein